MLRFCGGRGPCLGFTLIEGMVTVAILAIIASLAAPSFDAVLARLQQQTGADAVISGLQLARSEALRRNSPVRFTLTAASTSWTVATVSPAATVQSYKGSGAPQLSVTTNDGRTAVTFLATGLVDTSAARLQQVDLATSVSGVGSSRVMVFGGGQIRICDPSLTATGDPKKC